MLTTCQPKWKESLRRLTIAVKSTIGISKSMSSYTRISTLENHGYPGIYARSKVQHLLKGIKTTAFDTVKTRIISDATLCTDFDVCVNLFQDFIEQCGATHTPVHQRDTQLVSSKGETKASTGINKSTQAEDCHYKKEEYDALTLDQKKALHKKHGNCSHKSGAKDIALPSNLKPKTKASAKTMLSKHLIHAITTAVADHRSGNNSTGSTSSDEELDMKEAPCKKTKVSSNRNNSALQQK